MPQRAANLFSFLQLNLIIPKIGFDPQLLNPKTFEDNVSGTPTSRQKTELTPCSLPADA